MSRTLTAAELKSLLAADRKHLKAHYIEGGIIERKEAGGGVG